ncbi:MAG: adenylosuccinate synthase [Candidatus Micrarchaeota archaeon]|nr:adenylosuccinate synthase [Candidatus Micrarchaeota archaeon]
MKSTVIIGAQWGDEGKGKLVDCLCENYEAVVRYQGGNNAGHTVHVGKQVFKLQLMPSGVIRQKRSLIASGVVVDPRVLEKEIKAFSDMGIAVTPNVLGVDFRAHVIMPWHLYWDAARESGSHKIGTTGRGIGPVYEAKAARWGIRMEDLVSPKQFKAAMEKAYPVHARTLKEIFGINELPSMEKTLDEYGRLGKMLEPYLCDASQEVDALLSKNKRVLFEGAQGVMLDNNFGTYPYVTSSQPIAANAAASTGISPKRIGRVETVVKAYTTRVGEGPFPTELSGAEANALREKGKEFGTVTGRPRRVGWLDLTIIALGNRLNGYDGMHVTKLDVLDGIRKLKVCTGYRSGGKAYSYFPTRQSVLEKAEPVYETLDGFSDVDWEAVCANGRQQGLDALPKAAKTYVSFIENKTGVPVLSVSVGPGRDEIIWGENK